MSASVFVFVLRWSNGSIHKTRIAAHSLAEALLYTDPAASIVEATEIGPYEYIRGAQVRKVRQINPTDAEIAREMHRGQRVIEG